MELRNSFVFAPLFRFCNTVPFLYHCSVFSQGTTEQKRNSVVLYHCSVFSQGTTEQKRNSVVLYHCSVFFITEQKRNSVVLYHCSVFFSHRTTEQFRFCIAVPFLHYCSVFNTVPFLHYCSVFVTRFRFFDRFATDIMEYESRKLLCHPKDIVSSLRDRELKEMEGEEVIDIPKSEDADNSRVLRAKLLASSDSIAFSAKLGLLLLTKQLFTQ